MFRKMAKYPETRSYYWQNDDWQKHEKHRTGNISFGSGYVRENLHLFYNYLIKEYKKILHYSFQIFASYGNFLYFCAPNKERCSSG